MNLIPPGETPGRYVCPPGETEAAPRKSQRRAVGAQKNRAQRPEAFGHGELARLGGREAHELLRSVHRFPVN
jgi:hypothetical protein